MSCVCSVLMHNTQHTQRFQYANNRGGTHERNNTKNHTCQPLMVHAPDSSLMAGICPIRRRSDSILPHPAFSSQGDIFAANTREKCDHNNARRSARGCTGRGGRLHTPQCWEDVELLLGAVRRHNPYPHRHKALS